MFTDFEYADKRLSDFGWVAGHIGSNSGVTEVDIGCDITFNTVKNNHSSIHYVSSTSYDNVCTPQSWDIFKDPCGKNQEDMYTTNDEVSALTKWLNRHGYRKFKPLYHSDDSDVHYYGSFNVKKKTINDRVVGLVLTFNSNAPYGFGEQITNEVDMENNEVTASGNTLAISDCAAVPPINIKLFGKGKQETVPGNQLFDSTLFGTKSSGGASITNNGDGSFTVSGEGEMSANFSLRVAITHEDTLSLLKVGRITLDCLAESYPYFVVDFKNQSKTYFELGNYTSTGLMQGNITQEMLDDSEIYAEFIFYGVAGNTIIPNTIKPMLYQDGDGTWEPYVGGEQSPNMNYPQNAEFLGENGSIVGKVLRSNFLKLTGREVVTGNGSNLTPENPRYCNGNKLYVGISADNYYYNDNVASYKITDGTVIYTSNSVGGYGIGFDYPVKENQTYSIGYDAIKGEVKFNFLDKNGYHLQWGSGNQIDGGTSFTVPEGASYVIIIFVGLAKEEFVFENIRLNQGETLQPYEPCTEQPFTSLTPNGLRGIPLGQTIPDAIKNSPIHMSGVYWDEVEGQYYIADTENEDGKDVQRVDKLVINGDNWWVYTNYQGFATFEILPFTDNRREGFCNQVVVIPRSADNLVQDNGIWLGVDNNLIYVTHNTFYDETLEDCGLENFKAHLNENPLIIWTWLDEPIITETDSQYDVVMNYPNTTIVNDAGAYMEVTHVKDTQKHIEQNYVSEAMHEEHESRIAELEKAIVNS